MVEDIITALSRLRWLFVIARNSSFTYKGRAVDVKQVGRELGVRYVLEGSVRKAGEPRAHHRPADRRRDRRASLGRPLRRRARRRLRPAGPGDRERRRRDRAAGWSRPRSSAPSASRPRASTPTTTTCAAWRRSIASARPPTPRRWRCSPRRSSSIRTIAAAYGMAARCYLQRKGFGWVADRAAEIAETRRLARRAAELGRDDAVALANAGMAAGRRRRRARRRRGPARAGAGAEPEPRLGLAFQRARQGVPRRARGRDRAGRPRHAPQPAGPADLRHADGDRLGPFLPRPRRRGVALGRGRPAPAAQLPGRRLRRRGSAAQAGRMAEAARAMARLREHRSRRCGWATSASCCPSAAPQDFARWAEGLRLAGLPE